MSTGTPDATIARAVLADWLAARRAPPRPGALTVSALLDLYLDERRQRGVISIERLIYAAKPLRRYLGDRVLTEIDETVIAGYAAERAGRSHWTIRKEVATLNAALALAVRSGWLDQAPRLPLGRAPPGRDRWLREDEARALINAADAPHIRGFIMLGLHTGARKQAILGLTWDRVDFATGLITYAEPDRAETDKRRGIVPMNETLRAELLRLREIAVSDYVIEYGGHRLGDIKKGFAAAAKRAGLDRTTPHVLRHTCASLLAMRGISLDEIADLLAADPKTIARHYRKFQPGYLARATAALDDISAAPAALSPRLMRQMRRKQ